MTKIIYITYDLYTRESMFDAWIHMATISIPDAGGFIYDHFVSQDNCPPVIIGKDWKAVTI